jgi:hypothetical protein
MKTLAVVVMFGLIALIFFYDVLLGPEVFLDTNPARYDPWRTYASADDLAHNTYWRDSFLTYLPRRALLSESIRAGRLPFWNSYIFAGTPFLADPQSRVLYPIELLLVSKDPLRAMAYDVALHVFLAMLGMYLFLNSLKLKTWGAVLGACSYAFSSYFYVRYGQPTLIASAAWIPFFFYSFETSLRKEIRGTVLLTVSFAMGYLAGFPQVFLFGVLALAVYGTYLALDRPSGERRPQVLRTGRIIGVSGVLSMLLVSVQLLPFWEFYRNSVGLSYEQPTAGTDWSSLVRDAIHPYNPEFAVYGGIGALLTAIVALFLLRKSPRVRILLMLLILGVVVAVEPHAARVGHMLLPMFRASRVSRIAVIPCFALSTLAAIGFSTIASDGGPTSRRRLIIIATCVVAFAILFAVYFQFAGESVVERLAEKARTVPGDVWAGTHMSATSSKIREWVYGDTGEWLAYERHVLARGMLIVVVSCAAFVLWAIPAAVRRSLRTAIGVLFVLVVMLDVITTAGAYRTSQNPECVWETPGIEALRGVLGDQGRWRTKHFQPRVGDRLPFPPNTNQLFTVHSLQGSHTMNTESLDEFRHAYVESKKDAMSGERMVKTVGTGITWLANRLDDLMGVRYVIAERGQSRYAASSILRSILDVGIVSTRLKMVNLGGEGRFALCEDVDQSIRFKALFLEADILHFSVGFDSKCQEYGDSVFFLLTCESNAGRATFRKGLDQWRDRGKWHEAEIDISPIKNSMVDVTVSLVGSNAGDLLVAGWSGFEFVIHESPAVQSGDSYVLPLAGDGRCLSMKLTSDAREVPLDIYYDDDGYTRHHFSFQPGVKSRRVRIDLVKPSGNRLIVKSDSTFRMTDCREILREWGIDLDCHLIYDGDMCIYENSSAVAKGICIDRGQISLRGAGNGRVLALSELEDVYSVECGECEIVSYQPEEILLEVRSARPCYLVFQDMQYPGWRAYVDGRETGFVDTDIGIRAMELQPGRHMVTMTFRPSGLTAGIVLSCLGLALTIGYAFAFGRAASAQRSP